MPVPALIWMLLVVGKPAHENQSHHDTSGYDVLHHGCDSTGARPKMMNTMGAAVNANGRGKVCAFFRRRHRAEDRTIQAQSSVKRMISAPTGSSKRGQCASLLVAMPRGSLHLRRGHDGAMSGLAWRDGQKGTLQRLYRGPLSDKAEVQNV